MNRNVTGHIISCQELTNLFEHGTLAAMKQAYRNEHNPSNTVFSDSRARVTQGRVLAYPALILALVICLPFLLIGCSGGGSGGADSGSFEAQLVAGKIRYEQGGDEDVLFGSVRGSGVGGGWLEDVNDQRIPSSDLLFEPVANRYEIALRRSSGGFIPGVYKLKYAVAGEMKTFAPDTPHSWTLVPSFQGSPVLSYDHGSRVLSVTNIQLSGGQAARFSLRLYNANTGTLRRETTTPSVGVELREVVFESGDYKIELVGEVTQGGVVAARTQYVFKDIVVVP